MHFYDTFGGIFVSSDMPRPTSSTADEPAYAFVSEINEWGIAWSKNQTKTDNIESIESPDCVDKLCALPDVR